MPTTTLPPRVDEILEALQVLTQPGQLIEVRMLGVEYTPTHLSTDPREIAAEAMKYDGRAACIGITMNPIRPGTTKSAKDGDIERRVWLLIDCDPERESGQSSTDAEHEKALQRAGRIRDYLRGKGWPEPIEADSGNGAHLLYRIDLPNNDASTTLVERVLKALEYVFGDAAVHVDESVKTVGRLVKLYGTMACKGKNTPERPHRRSRLLHIPDDIQVVTREQLEAVAAMWPDEREAERERGPNGKALDIEAWLEKYGIAVERVKLNSGCIVYRLRECPWSDEHTSGTGGAAVFQFDSGALAFKCHHSHCQSRKWHDFRTHFEPAAYTRQDGSTATGDALHDGWHIISAHDLVHKQFAPTKWAIEGVLPEGASLLAGKPKQGKSWMALDWAIAVATGGIALGNIPVDPGSVLYLCLEGGEAQLQRRLKALLGDETPPRGLDLVTAKCPRLGMGLIELLTKWCEAHPDARLIIVDTLAKVRPARRPGESEYEYDYRSVEPLQLFSAAHRVAVLIVTHTRQMAAEDDQDEISGTTGLTGAADGTLVLRRERTADTATLSLRGRDVEEQMLALVWERSRCRWKHEGDARLYQMTEMQRRIVEAITELGGKATARQVADHTGLPYENVRQCMWQMSRPSQNKLSVEGRGVYVLQDSTESPNNPNNANNHHKANNPNNPAEDVVVRASDEIVRTTPLGNLTIVAHEPGIEAGNDTIVRDVSKGDGPDPTAQPSETHAPTLYEQFLREHPVASYPGGEREWRRAWKAFFNKQVEIKQAHKRREQKSLLAEKYIAV